MTGPTVDAIENMVYMVHMTDPDVNRPVTKLASEARTLVSVFVSDDPLSRARAERAVALAAFGDAIAFVAWLLLLVERWGKVHPSTRLAWDISDDMVIVRFSVDGHPWRHTEWRYLSDLYLASESWSASPTEIAENAWLLFARELAARWTPPVERPQ